MLLNLLHLQPGQAIYSEAGNLHAYLQGFGVELMANSDNVLRGVLTVKHVDPDELLQTLTFDCQSERITHIDRNVESNTYRVCCATSPLQQLCSPSLTIWHSGMTDGLKQARLDSNTYELHSILLCAIEVPDAAQRWLQRHDVFAGCTVGAFAD